MTLPATTTAASRPPNEKEKVAPWQESLASLRPLTLLDLAERRCAQYRVDGYEALADAVWHFADELRREIEDLDAAAASLRSQLEQEITELEVEGTRCDSVHATMGTGYTSAAKRLRALLQTLKD